MQEEYTCDSCGATLDVIHRRGYGQRDLHADIAYCNSCAILYEAERSTGVVEFEETVTRSLHSRLQAVNEETLTVMERGLTTDVAWARSLRNHEDAALLKTLVTDDRITSADATFRNAYAGEGAAEHTRLWFKTDCAICDENHTAQISETEFSEVLGFNGDAVFRCRCGEKLSAEQHEWRCGECGRTYEWRCTEPYGDEG